MSHRRPLHQTSCVRVLCRLLAVVYALLLGVGGLNAYAQSEKQTPEFGLRFLQDQQDERFQDVTLDRLPVQLQHSIRGTALLLFRTEAMPFAFRPGKVELVPAPRPTDAKLRAFAARGPKERDLIEASWSHRGVPLRWVLSANVTDIQFPLRPFREGTTDGIKGKDIKDFVADIFRLEGEIPGLDRDYAVALEWPEKIEDGVSFSSNPKVGITNVIWWFDRWDVVVKDDTVHILIYSRDPQIAGFDDGSSYFPPEFRKRLNP